jgi:type VI secretion system protein ImpC
MSAPPTLQQLLIDELGPAGAAAEGPLAATMSRRALERFLGSASPESLLDALIATVDRAVAALLDAVLAHPTFRALEERWRGLYFLVQRFDRSDNISVELLNASQEDLLFDFEDAPAIPKSGLYKIVYSGEYGPFGGRPYAAVFAHYTLGPDDLRLLRLCGDVASRAALLFVAEAGDTLEGELATHEGLRLAERARPEHRAVALVRGRFVGRERFVCETDYAALEYREADGAPVTLPGVLALAATMVRSFSALRTPGCAAGPIFGMIGAVPDWVGDEVASARSAPALSASAAGALGLTTVESLEGSAVVAHACIFGGGSPEDPSFETTLLGQRLVQYLKVLQREQIGTWKEREELERELAEWLAGYVQRVVPAPPAEASAAEHELAAAVERDPSNHQARIVYADALESRGRLLEAAIARQPVRRQLSLDVDLPSTRCVLAAASIEVVVPEDGAGWYRATLTITPATGDRRALRIPFYLDLE